MELTINEITALETVRAKINNFCEKLPSCSKCSFFNDDKECVAATDLIGVILEKFGNKEG